MKLEVLVNDKDPKIYFLDKDKVVIGSHESCHIVINEPSISRKHAIVFIKDDKFFIADQGSVNGTFLNDESLVPGKKTEMTIYSPIRLGTNVLLTLITEEEAAELEEILPLNEYEEKESEEKTQVISLAELKKKHTEELQLKRAQALSGRKKKIKKKKKFPLFSLLIGISLVSFFLKNYSEKRVPKESKTSMGTFLPSQIERLDINDLIASDILLEAFKTPKCTSDLGKTLCSLIPSINHKNFGPVIINKDIIIIADGDLVIPHAQELLPKKELNERELHSVALIFWVNKNITEKLQEIKNINEYRITIALMNHTKQETNLLFNSIFVPSALLQFKNRIRPEHFEMARKNGALEFYYYTDYGRYSQ